MPLKKRLVKQRLLYKGFQQEDDRDHEWFFVYHDGKKTTINTKYSRGSGNEISDGLLRLMRNQMHLSKKDFDKYMECTLSKKEYIQHLLDEHLI